MEMIRRLLSVLRRAAGEPEFLRKARRFKSKLDRVKAAVRPQGFSWYPYDSFTNLYPIAEILRSRPAFFRALADQPALDLGCGDGDLAFFLESLGLRVHAIDFPATNYNRMQGVRALKAALGSMVEVQEMDLDSRFALPSEHYACAFFLGTLYHLKNPFYALENLSGHAKWCLLSSRVARMTPDHRVRLEDRPLAYLLDAGETNNDPTNYWIFSNTGLRRLVERTGWELLEYYTTGNTRDSDPVSPRGDERAFCLLRSRQFS